MTALTVSIPHTHGAAWERSEEALLPPYHYLSYYSSSPGAACPSLSLSDTVQALWLFVNVLTCLTDSTGTVIKINYNNKNYEDAKKLGDNMGFQPHSVPLRDSQHLTVSLMTLVQLKEKQLEASLLKTNKLKMFKSQVVNWTVTVMFHW